MARTICLVTAIMSLLPAKAAAAILPIGEVSPFYENLATLDHGTRIASPAEGLEGFDLRSIIDPQLFLGPQENGTFIFADQRQREVFTIDFGEILQSGVMIIRTVAGDGPVFGNPDKRRPEQMIIEASADGSNQSWRKLRECIGVDNVPRRQSIIWDHEPIRCLRFDLGMNTDGIGTRMGQVSLFRRLKFPSMQERLGDLDELLRPDVPELEPFRVALAAGDQNAAIGALRSHFAKAPVQAGRGADKHGCMADEWIKNIVSFEDRSWQLPGHKFDWYFFPCELSNEPPSYWVAGAQFWYLPDYFNGTKDTKYARYAARMIRDWLADVPCPGVHRVPGFKGHTVMIPGWEAIRVANRTGGLARAVAVFAPYRQDFDDETWIHLLYAVWEHNQFLAHVAPELDGNWLTWVSERAMLTAKQYPEFRDQPAWLSVARKFFEQVVQKEVSDDGKECEDSTFYCIRAMGEIIRMYEMLKESGAKITPLVEARVCRALDFPAWTFLPDFRNPGVGDACELGAPGRSIPLVNEYAAKWGRDDLVYINTRGGKGKKPAQNSRAFLDDGWFVMRSDFDDGLDARHLIFRSPPAGCRGHGHRDVLAILLYAYGRPLLIDAGMPMYGTKNVEQYILTCMHNTVTIDEKPQEHGPGRVNRWETTAKYDLADAEHALYHETIHRRRVIFVKPDYYVVIDDLAGQGEHVLDWNYRFLEGAAPTQSEGIIRTNFPEGGNLAIVPVQPDDSSVSRSKQFNYMVSEKGKRLKEISSIGWLVRMRGELPKKLVTILFPFNGQRLPSGLRIHMTQSNVLTIRYANQTDTVAWRPADGKGTWDFNYQGNKREIRGGVVVLRTDRPN